MRKLVLAGLAAAIALPGMAFADSADRAELRRDQVRIANEHRDYHDALRHGSRADVREERREYRDAVREYHDDARDYARDRQDRRYDGRDTRHHDRWMMNHRYGDGRGYFRYRSGYDLPRHYWNGRYAYNGGRYGHPGRGLRWVRYYDDLLLVNRAGRIVDVRYDAF